MLGASLVHVTAQPSKDISADTVGLKAQKENIITAETILKIENIGDKINTQLEELRPTISADGNLLFFIRQNDPANTNYNSVPNSQDIWFSERDDSGKWSEAEHLLYPLNTTDYNAVFWISPDNNRVLIRNAFINGDYMGNGVSMSYLNKYGNWSKPEMLKIKNYGKYDRGNQTGSGSRKSLRETDAPVIHNRNPEAEDDRPRKCKGKKGIVRPGGAPVKRAGADGTL